MSPCQKKEESPLCHQNDIFEQSEWSNMLYTVFSLTLKTLSYYLKTFENGQMEKKKNSAPEELE